MNRDSDNEIAASERGLFASKNSLPTRPPAIKGGDWLTNIDAPAAVEADRRLGSLLNWDHVWYAMPSTAAVAPVPPAKTGPLASYSGSSAPAEASVSSVAPVVPPPVSEAQKGIPGPLWGKHDDLTCHAGELQSPTMNHINPTASTANELYPQRDSVSGTKLPFVHQFANFQPQNISSSPASSLTSGPRLTNFSSNGLLLPDTHRHASNPLLTSPSRQRSLNDLSFAAPVPPPTAITRPRSIPISSASRFIPPGLMPLSSVADFNTNGLHLQKFAHVPNFYNDDGNIHLNNGNGNNSNNKPTNGIIRNNLISTSESKFVPMLSITRPDRTGRDLTPFLQQSTHHGVSSLKFSPRYHGMHTENNASMEHLAPEQNCALWLTNLPPDIRERELLACVRNIGRVYATFINGPDGQAHATSAAKLVFFTPEAARKLLVYCTLVKPMVIRGHRVKIALNRIKYAKNSMDNGESRVLIITGHRKFVNEASLTLFFQSRFQFQIDEAATLITHKERAVVEYKFGSYRCQAQMGMKALLLDKPAGLEMVEYGADPCEVGSEVTSFTVAGERIQGRGLLLKE
ncbi:hypothetical protein E4U21_002897 [Claviceps maximensis]|nr:hypothetical protein E4U21_002897 [Claviceps maximensis]